MLSYRNCFKMSVRRAPGCSRWPHGKQRRWKSLWQSYRSNWSNAEAMVICFISLN